METLPCGSRETLDETVIQMKNRVRPESNRPRSELVKSMLML